MREKRGTFLRKGTETLFHGGADNLSPVLEKSEFRITPHRKGCLLRPPPLTSIILLNPCLSHPYPLLVLVWGFILKKQKVCCKLKGKCSTFWASVQSMVLLNKHSIYVYCTQGTVIHPGEKKTIKGK